MKQGVVVAIQPSLLVCPFAALVLNNGKKVAISGKRRKVVESEKGAKNNEWENHR